LGEVWVHLLLSKPTIEISFMTIMRRRGRRGRRRRRRRHQRRRRKRKRTRTRKDSSSFLILNVESD
jgi:hypothetical protein